MDEFIIAAAHSWLQRLDERVRSCTRRERELRALTRHPDAVPFQARQCGQVIARGVALGAERDALRAALARRVR